MAFAILRTKKLTTWGNIGGSVGHTDRVGGMAPNADPERLKLNKTLVGTKGDTVKELRERVGEITTKPRKNGVLAIELFCGVSPEWAKGKSAKELASWARSNVEWMRNEFGAANVISATIHRDESTPHIVAYIVPERGGKLNARAIIGGRNNLSAMQTRYADAMKIHGLERGIEGSKAEHQTLKRFYGRISSNVAEAEKYLAELGEPAPPPSMPLLSGREARTAALAGWTAQERVRTVKLAETASAALLDSHVAKEQNEHLKERNSVLSADVGDLRMKLSQAYEQIGLSKEQISALRSADVSLVATRLGHMGEVKPRENAIDLVKRVGGFDYGQAVAWLHAEFGPLVAGAVVTASLQSRPPERPLTKSENVICQAVKAQTDALGCDKYRVTLVPSDETKKPYLPGKSRGKDSEERFYTRNQLLEIVPWLRTRNNLGDNIFITPMDDNAFYILLDDAKISASELEKRGFQPCLVQRTSWEKEQVVFKVPKDLDREEVIKLFNAMNKSWGDDKMTGLRHPFRLAGLRNMKPKYEAEGKRPFIQILLAVNRFCTGCTEAIRRQMVSTLAKPVEPPQRAFLPIR